MPFYGGIGGQSLYELMDPPASGNIRGGLTSLVTTTGVNNLALGNGASQKITTGSRNISIGNDAGNEITTSFDNISMVLM